MKLNKIIFPGNYKSYFTLSNMDEVEAAKQSIKNDDGKIDLTFEAELLLSVGSDSKMLPCDILFMGAEWAKNSRVKLDRYCEGSGHMDVWLTVQAFDHINGFYEVAGYLSDIWEVGSDNREEVKDRLLIKHYSEDK